MAASNQLKPDYEKLVKSYEEDHGWTRERRTNKMKVSCPCGKHVVFVQFTPSSQRSLSNLKATFKRKQRDCTNENKGVEG